LLTVNNQPKFIAGAKLSTQMGARGNTPPGCDRYDISDAE